MQHSIKDEITAVLAFVGSIWVVFLLDQLLPVELLRFGVTPRNVFGLTGIITMPFLHANLSHLLSNTVPLFVLLTLLAGSRARSEQVVLEVTAASGSLLWVIGRPYTHVGASALIFALVAFLIVSGFRETRVKPLLVSLLVCFLYGGTLLSGVVPQQDATISWDGHLSGAIAGASIAWLRTRPSAEKIDALPGTR